MRQPVPRSRQDVPLSYNGRSCRPYSEVVVGYFERVNDNVMSEMKSKRSKILQVRITPKEWDTINEKCSRSTCQKLSDYIRKKIFDKPITTYTRNQSLDDCMHELIRLKTELNSIGVNYNQVVKKMYTLDHTYEVKMWLLQHDHSEGLLMAKMNDIHAQIAKINDAWLQS